VILDRARERLAVEFVEPGLGFEQVHVARPALHEQRDHRPGPRLEVRLLRPEVEVRLLRVREGRVGEQPLPVEQVRQRDRAEAEGAGVQEVAARERVHGGCTQSTYRKRLLASSAWQNAARARAAADGGSGAFSPFFGGAAAGAGWLRNASAAAARNASAPASSFSDGSRRYASFQARAAWAFASAPASVRPRPAKAPACSAGKVPSISSGA